MSTGYLLINKPSGPTSHDVIDELRRITGEQRIGHAGTLDPFAEGLLLIGVGREATRNLGKFVGLDKRYSAVLRLGAVSETYDRMGKIFNFQFSIFNDESGMTNQESRIKEVLKLFIGKQKQTPPQYSAKRVKGKKAYQFARQGMLVELPPQEIEIYDIKLLASNYNQQPATSNQLTIDVHCSSGTYIRSLANDIGEKLGCGAYLDALTRTAIGNFEIYEAFAIPMKSAETQNFASLQINSKNWRDYLINFHTVMAAGTFEALHPGHLHYLKEARKIGERLVVVVARDKTAEKIRDRKLRVSEDARLKAVANLDFVDKAVLGDENDPYETVRKIKPDIIALGYDQRSFVKGLPEKIQSFGLKTKIARIGAYKPEQFKSSKIATGLPFLPS